MVTPDDILDRLDGLRVRWWLFTTLCTFVSAVIASLLLLAMLTFAGAVATPPRPLLAAAFALWWGLSALLVVLATRRCVRAQRSLQAAARRVELTFPELENNLISLVQWAELPDAAQGFQRTAVEQATRSVAGVPLEAVASRHDRRRRWRLATMTARDLLECCALLAAQLAILAALSTIPSWSRASDRLWDSFAGEPSVSVHEPAARPSAGEPSSPGESDER